MHSSRFNKVSYFWIHNELFFNKLRDNCFGIWWVKEICTGSIFVWHKRRYHTHTDVIFGWVAWIWLSISTFLLSILTLFSWCVIKLKNHTGAHRRARGAPLRPPFGASRLSPASAPPLGPGGVPPCDFSILPHIMKKCQDISKKVEISAKSTLSAKKTSVSV